MQLGPPVRKAKLSGGIGNEVGSNIMRGVDRP